MKMERPPKIYFCNKCGYVGISDTHPGCQYLAYLMANPEQLYIDHLEAELAALRASPASASEGWKLVPFEPTDAMIECGCRALGALYGQYGASEAYRAMLIAAPPPPVSEDQRDAERYRKLKDMIQLGCYQLWYWDTDRDSWYVQDFDVAMQEGKP